MNGANTAMGRGKSGQTRLGPKALPPVGSKRCPHQKPPKTAKNHLADGSDSAMKAHGATQIPIFPA